MTYVFILKCFRCNKKFRCNTIDDIKPDFFICIDCYQGIDVYNQEELKE